MVYQLKAYRSVTELLSSVAVEMEQTRNQLKRALEACSDVRKRSDRAKRLQQVFASGSKPGNLTPIRGVRLGELEVLVNAGAEDELLALELMARAQNERLNALQKIREALAQMEKKAPREYLDEISCLVIENDGIPRKLMFHDKESFESPAMNAFVYGEASRLGVAAGSPPTGQSKLAEVQLEMASLEQQSSSRPVNAEVPNSNNHEEEFPVSDAGSQGRFGNVLRFLTAKPLRN